MNTSYTPVVAAESYTRREGVVVAISYGGRDGRKQGKNGEWVDDEATAVLQDVLDPGELAMNYGDRNGRCNLRYLTGEAKLTTKVDKATEGGEFADKLTSAGFNVASIFAGPWASAAAATKDLYDAASVVTREEDRWATEAFFEPSFSILKPGEVISEPLAEYAPQELRDRIDQDAGSHRISRGGNMTSEWTSGTLQVQTKQKDVTTGQTLLVYADIGARVQARAVGYLDYWGLFDDPPECKAESRLTADQGATQNGIQIYNRMESGEDDL